MGLVILDEEVDSLLGKEVLGQSGQDNHAGSPAPELESLGAYLQQLNLRIAEKASASLNSGIFLPIAHLIKVMQLTPFEMDCLLILLAAELDLKYEKLYAYLLNDVTKKRPVVGLLLDLLCTSPEEKARAWGIFTSQGHLFKYHLVEFSEEVSGRHVPLINQSLKVDERIASFLLGFETVDLCLRPFVKVAETRLKLEDVIVPAELKEKAANISVRINNYTRNNPETASPKRFIMHLKGLPDNGQRQVAGAICRATGLGLLEVDIEKMSGPAIPLNLAMQFVFREALLRTSAVYLRGFDRLLDEDGGRWQGSLLDIIEEYDASPVFLESQKNWEPGCHISLTSFYKLDFTIPPYTTRKDLWEYHLNSYQIRNGFDKADLASKFQLTGGQINEAIATAISAASMRSEDKSSVTAEDIIKGCRAASNQKLISLARQVRSRYGWNDIVLPKDALSQLQDICSYVKYRYIVYDDWGFDVKLSQGKGLNILFHGPSGTGKTMAAEVIAGELGLELYKIDLSLVVSKYIGETEKNLNRIFSEAQTSNCILFFDEADALFGKRSEVKDAHDRYANIEVAYLLQKVEEYEGIVILATNLVKNMDDAFTRRMHFSVEFPFPDEELRLKIWESILPHTAPRANDIAFEFLAKKLKIAGGNIKNIAVSAAFLAAKGSGIIDMRCIILAAKREFQKIGILSIPSDFGAYYHLTLES